MKIGFFVAAVITIVAIIIGVKEAKLRKHWYYYNFRRSSRMKEVHKTILNYDVVFKEESDGTILVTVPDLPGCITYGNDLDDATKMAKDAIKSYLDASE